MPGPKASSGPSNQRPAGVLWVAPLKGTPDLDAGVAGDPGITALAVASLMYSKAVQSDPVLATRYAAMIEALMDAGANPLVQIGERFVVRRGTGKLERRRVDEGRTLAEVCGAFCPAMQAWFGRQRAGEWSHTALHRPHPPTPTSVATIKPWPELRPAALAAERRVETTAGWATASAGPRGAEPKTSAPLKPLAAWLLRE